MHKYFIAIILLLLCNLSSASAEDPRVSFFGDLSLKSAYVTPRGLVVEDKGIATQVLGITNIDFYRDSGLIKTASLKLGAWSNFLTHAVGASLPDGTRPEVDHFNEIDPFIGVGLKVDKNWDLGAQFVTFISPPGLFDPEYNIQFSVSYDDTDHLGSYALHPYVKPFWTYSGDSTVVLGKVPAWYTELG